MKTQGLQCVYRLLHAARQSRARHILGTVRDVRILEWGHDEDKEQLFVAQQGLDGARCRVLSIERLAAERNMNVPERETLSDLLAQGWGNN